MGNISSLKSTILGLGLMVFSSLLIYEDITHDYWINGVLYLLGIMFFFTGDGWVSKLEDVLFGYLKKKSDVDDDK